MEVEGAFANSINASVKDAIASEGDLIKKLDFLFTNDTGIITHSIVMTDTYAALIDFEISRDVSLVPAGNTYLKMHEYFPITDFTKFSISEVDYGTKYQLNMGDGNEREFLIDYVINSDSSKLYSSVMEQLPFMKGEWSMKKDILDAGYSNTRPIWGVARVINGKCEILGIYLINHPKDIKNDSEATSISRVTAHLNQLLHNSVRSLSKFEITAYSSIVDRFIGESVTIPYSFFNRDDGFLKDPFFVTLSKKVCQELGFIGIVSYAMYRDDTNLFISINQSLNKKDFAAFTLKLPFDSIKNSKDRITTKKIKSALKKHMAILRNEKGISQNAFKSRYEEEGSNFSRVILGLRLSMKGGEAIGAIPHKNQFKVKWHHENTVKLSKIIPILLNLCIARFDPFLSKELRLVEPREKRKKRHRKGKKINSRTWDWGTDSIRYIKANNSKNKMASHWVSPFVRTMEISRNETILRYQMKGWPIMDIDGKKFGARMIKRHMRGKGKTSEWNGNYRFGKNPSYYSMKAINWIKSIELEEGITIQHAETRGGEKRLENGDSYIKVDGYCSENNTIYEFHGDYWHGNPLIYNPTEINKKSKKSYGELYELTKLKERCIEEMGYNLVIMWENVWDAHNNANTGTG